MKVLIVHNEYREPGGEEKVVDAETRLLRENGVEVRELRFRSADVKGAFGALRTAWELPHSERSKERVAEALREFRPNLMHVHNFFPVATPAIFEAAREAGVRSVLTLHNYRILCVNGLLLREGQPCELCIERRGPTSGVVHACYNNSRLASATVARMIHEHQRRGTWHKLVDRFIVLTEFAKSRYVKAGLDPARFAVKPNFLFDPGAAATGGSAGGRPQVLFVGRLSHEKGLGTLLRAKAGAGGGANSSSSGYDLHIVGDGPLREEVKAAAAKDASVIWHGFRNAEQVRAHLLAADILVFPSECYENFPITLLEAMAAARPALISRIGGLPELLAEGKEGLFFTPGSAEDLANRLSAALRDQAQLGRMGQAARERYLGAFGPRENFRRLMEIYGEAMGAKTA